MNRLALLASLLGLANAQTADQKACAKVKLATKNAVGPWVKSGQTDLTAQQKAAFDQALDSAFDTTGTQGTYKPILTTEVNEKVTQYDFVVEVGGLTKEEAGGLRMGISMGQDRLVENCNTEVDTYWLNNSLAAADKAGATLAVSYVECESATDSVKPTKLNAKAIVKGVFRMKLLGDICAKIQDQDVFDQAYAAVEQAVINSFRLPPRKVILNKFAKTCAQSGARRLFATESNPQVEYELDDMSVGQTEAATAAAGSPAFQATLAANIAKEDPTGALGLQGAKVDGSSVQVEGEGKKFVYNPPEYERSTDVGSFHNLARLHGSNEPNLETPDSQENVDWIIGAVLTATPCFLCVWLSVCPFPCVWSCCIKAPKGREKPMLQSPQFWAAIVFAVLTFIGFTTGLAGEVSTSDAMEGLGDTVQKVADYVGGLDSSITKIGGGTASLSTQTATNKDSCQGTKSLYDSSSGFKTTSPFPDSIAKDLADVKKQILDSNSMRSTASTVFILIPTIMSFFLAVAVVQLKTGKFEVLRKVLNCGVCIMNPVVLIFLICMWLVAGVNMILSVVFSDICYEDPLKTIGDFAPEELTYFLTCKGNPPAEIYDIMDIGSTMSEAAAGVDGLAVMINSGAAGDCSGTPIDDIKSSINTISVGILEVVDKLRCLHFNEIVTTVLYDVVCGDLVSGAAATWIGLVFISVGLLGNWFLYRRVHKMKQLDRKIQPEEALEDPALSPLEVEDGTKTTANVE